MPPRLVSLCCPAAEAHLGALSAADRAQAKDGLGVAGCRDTDYNGTYLPCNMDSPLQAVGVYGGPHCVNAKGKHLYCGPTGKWCAAAHQSPKLPHIRPATRVAHELAAPNNVQVPQYGVLPDRRHLQGLLHHHCRGSPRQPRLHAPDLPPSQPRSTSSLATAMSPHRQLLSTFDATRGTNQRAVPVGRTRAEDDPKMGNNHTSLDRLTQGAVALPAGEHAWQYWDRDEGWVVQMLTLQILGRDGRVKDARAAKRSPGSIAGSARSTRASTLAAEDKEAARRLRIEAWIADAESVGDGGWAPPATQSPKQSGAGAGTARALLGHLAEGSGSQVREEICDPTTDVAEPVPPADAPPSKPDLRLR